MINLFSKSEKTMLVIAIIWGMSMVIMASILVAVVGKQIDHHGLKSIVDRVWNGKEPQ